MTGLIRNPSEGFRKPYEILGSLDYYRDMIAQIEEIKETTN